MTDDITISALKWLLQQTDGRIISTDDPYSTQLANQVKSNSLPFNERMSVAPVILSHAMFTKKTSLHNVIIPHRKAQVSA